MINTIRILVLVSLVGILSINAEALMLVDNSVPKAKIVVATDAAGTVGYAAEELQIYIEKITGAKLPIERVGSDIESILVKNQNYVFVGESSYTRKLGISVKELNSDGFRIIAKDNYFVLIGRDYKGEPMEGYRNPFRLRESYNSRLGLSAFGETGTLYAVYSFLESLGVRWFMPGEYGEVVPKQNSIKIDAMNIQKAPAFEYRYPNFATLSSNEEGARWFKRAGFGARTVVNINHSFYLFKKYRESHPEYFAIIDGERDFDKTCQGQGSLCLSEPGTLRQWVEDIREYFDANPQILMYPVFPNDSYERICECPKCKGKDDLSMGEDGKFSDYVWGFVDRVARETYKTHPDRYIICLAYGHFMSPPKTIEKFSPNVAVMIAKNRKNYWNTNYKNITDNHIKKWSEKINNIYIWEYYCWYNRYLTYYKYKDDWGFNLLGVPIFFFHVTKNDLEYLKRNNVKGEFIEVDNFEWPALLCPTLYITAKLLWDPGQDVDALLDDYCEKFYGPAAAESMKKFFRRAEEIWTKPEKDAPDIAWDIKYDRVKAVTYKNKEIVNELSGYLWKALDGAVKTNRDSCSEFEYFGRMERIRLLINETLVWTETIK